MTIKELIAKIFREPKSLTGKTLLLTVAKVISMGANIGTPFVLVRILSQHDFGVYGIAFLVVTTVHDLVGLSIGNSAAFFIPRKELDPGKVLGTILTLNAAIGVAVMTALWAAPEFFARVFGSEDIIPLLPLIAMVLLAWNLARAMALVPIALGKSAVSAMYVSVTDFTKPLFVLLPALYNPTVETILWGFLSWSLLRAVVALYYFHVRLKVRLTDFDKPTLKRLIGYAAPHAAYTIVVIIFQRYHQFLVTHEFDEATYAIYRNGVMQLPFIMILLESANSIMIPEIARQQANADHEASIALTIRVFVRLAVFFLPATLFLEIFAEEFITALFTADYAASAPIFRVNLLQLPLLIIALDPLMRGIEKLKYFRLKIYSVLLCAMLLLGNSVVTSHGPIGATWMTLTALTLAQAACFIQAGAFLGLKWSHRKHARPLWFVLRGCAGAAIAAFLLNQALLENQFLTNDISPFARSIAVLSSCGLVFLGAYWLCFEGSLRLTRTRETLGLFRGIG